MDYMTTKDAAEKLDVSLSEVWRLLAAGLLTGERLGRAWAISESDIADYEERRRGRGRPASEQ